MRVIAGTARRLILKTLPGSATRPTQDIIRETLFNVLQNAVPGARFLDLFAGSGAVGIEALSRGAGYVVFVENSRKAAEIIEENLEHTHLKERARVVVSDALMSMNRLSGEEPFDLVYLDPPYGMGLEKPVLEALRSGSLVTKDTILTLETLKKADCSFLEELGYAVFKDKPYKANRHIYFRPV
ncbi:MAG: 16S rRNA (guanine(966)-N(2))-methyltransferase RsmD [Lachnospiraceae bacterium]|nr:16S rRNA (guanine(966)-N(2))-methyltransferase RsmD [Lachnospiraceae bacterium]